MTTIKLNDVGIELNEIDTYNGVLYKITEATMSKKYGLGTKYIYDTWSGHLIQIVEKLREEDNTLIKVVDNVYQIHYFKDKIYGISIYFDNINQITDSIKEFIEKHTGLNLEEAITTLRILEDTSITEDLQIRVENNEIEDYFDPRTRMKIHTRKHILSIDFINNRVQQ